MPKNIVIYCDGTERYEAGDQVYLFGFSRGAYTVRALGGLLQLVGLLNLSRKI